LSSGDSMPGPGTLVTDYTLLLSPECEDYLASQELYGVQSVLRVDEVCIHDTDGDRVFTVTKTIDVRDLRTAYFHGMDMHNKGLRGGRAGLQAALRNLLDAAQQPAEDDL
jgi:hypothetical protein